MRSGAVSMSADSRARRRWEFAFLERHDPRYELGQWDVERGRKVSKGAPARVRASAVLDAAKPGDVNLGLLGELPLRLAQVDPEAPDGPTKGLGACRGSGRIAAWHTGTLTSCRPRDFARRQDLLKDPVGSPTKGGPLIGRETDLCLEEHGSKPHGFLDHPGPGCSAVMAKPRGDCACRRDVHRQCHPRQRIHDLLRDSGVIVRPGRHTWRIPQLRTGTCPR
jgi:hypothetical protein